MPAQLTYQAVKQIFEDAECTLVSKEYKGIGKKLEYICSCGSSNIHIITLMQFKRGDRCKECRLDRLKATNKIRHGYEFVSQRPDKKESALSGIRKHIAEKKHTLEELLEFYKATGCTLLETDYKDRLTPMRFICVCGKEGQNTFGHFQAGQRCSDPVCMDIRKKQTNLVKFGDTSYTRTDAYKESRKATCLEKYNVEHPMQNADVMAKADKTGLTFKLYTFPSGRQEKVQGYEPLALDYLLKTYNEDDIKVNRKEQPEIWYTSTDGIKHRYFSDIYIPKANLIVEVKSSWTYKLGMKLGKIQLQEQACKDAGFDYLRLVYNDRHQLVENEDIEEEPTNELIYEDETQEEDEDTEEFLECIKPYLQEA
jgi:hypothetical protein